MNRGNASKKPNEKGRLATWPHQLRLLPCVLTYIGQALRYRNQPFIIKKKKKKNRCEIEGSVEPNICKLCVILLTVIIRSSVHTTCGWYDPMKDVCIAFNKGPLMRVPCFLRVPEWGEQHLTVAELRGYAYRNYSIPGTWYTSYTTCATLHTR